MAAAPCELYVLHKQEFAEICHAFPNFEAMLASAQAVDPELAAREEAVRRWKVSAKRSLRAEKNADSEAAGGGEDAPATENTVEGELDTSHAKHLEKKVRAPSSSRLFRTRARCPLSAPNVPRRFVVA